MQAKRLLIGAVGALAGVLAVVSAPGTVQAAAPASHGATMILTAPAAPSGAQEQSVRPAVAAPSISPVVSTQHVASGGSYSCPIGTLCAAVWDPTTSNYKVFHLAICAKYALSYWSGTGSYFDNQTGGVTSYFYGKSGNTLKSFKPDATNYSYVWDNVWSIRNCT